MNIIRRIAIIISSSILLMALANGSAAQSVLSDPADEADKSGTVVSVSPERDNLAVKLDDEANVEIYNISDDTDITVRGRSGDLDDLAPGDRILMNFAEASDRTRTARQINQDETPADKKAEVIAVDTAANELTVRFVDTDTVDSYYIDADTDIWVRGRAADLADIRDGDEVILDFEERENNRRVIRWVTYNVYPTADMLIADTASSTAAATNQGTLARLPSTASPVPLVGLAGVLLISLASTLRILRRKTS